MMTAYLQVLSDYAFAGRVENSRSNKDWIACLARRCSDAAETQPNLSQLPEDTPVVFLCAHGRHGSNLVLEPPVECSLKAGRVLYQKKVQNKQQKSGYVSTTFAPYVKDFGTPLGLTLVGPASLQTHHVLNARGERETTERAAPFPGGEPPASPASDCPYAASTVESVTRDQLIVLLRQRNYALAEKVDGERCLLAYDGLTLRAYNRRRMQMSAPPERALALCALRQPFVLDGERLTGDLAGGYVAFDLLEWAGEDIRSSPYHQRIGLLRRQFLQQNLLREDRPTPTFVEAYGNSLVSGCVLLLEGVSEWSRAQLLLQQVQSVGGEGVILRRLAAPYDESPLKWKFVADLDAIVYGIEKGTTTGSLKLGLIRPADGVLVDIGCVRSGLTNQDILDVQNALSRGEQLVYKVAFLPKRTVGLSLVEPRTGRDCRRSDKPAEECTTDQFYEHFGESKNELIAQAPPVQPSPNSRSSGRESRKVG